MSYTYLIRRHRRLFVVLCLLVSGGLSAADVSFRDRAGTVPEGLPFSEAVRVGDTLYLSGQVGILKGTLDLAPGGIVPESRQALDNIRSVVKANGLDMQDLVKCTVMLADIDDWPAFNTVYSEFFEPPYPARSAFATTGLALGARVEVECLGVYPD
jgi:reactive intermediate/imine deaminase